MKQAVKILSIDLITHDVIRIRTEKPHSLSYKPGQAVDVSINKPGWETELRSFTFTSLPDDDHLEFTIKSYTSHHGVTEQLRNLRADDELFIHDVYVNYLLSFTLAYILGLFYFSSFVLIQKKQKIKAVEKKLKILISG